MVGGEICHTLETYSTEFILSQAKHDSSSKSLIRMFDRTERYVRPTYQSINETDIDSFEGIRGKTMAILQNNIRRKSVNSMSNSTHNMKVYTLTRNTETAHALVNDSIRESSVGKEEQADSESSVGELPQAKSAPSFPKMQRRSSAGVVAVMDFQKQFFFLKSEGRNQLQQVLSMFLCVQCVIIAQHIYVFFCCLTQQFKNGSI